MLHDVTVKLTRRRGRKENIFLCPPLPTHLKIYGHLYTRGRILRLDELGQIFVIRLVIRILYYSVKTGTRRIIIFSTSDNAFRAL